MMDLGYELLKGKFDYCKKVTWEDVIDKIDYEANLEPVTSILLYDSSSCLLYTSPSPRDATLSRMPSSA